MWTTATNSKNEIAEIGKYCMYRIGFDFTRRHFGVSLFFTQNSEILPCEVPVLKLPTCRSEGINGCIIRWLSWKQGLPVVTVFLATMFEPR